MSKSYPLDAADDDTADSILLSFLVLDGVIAPPEAAVDRLGVRGEAGAEATEVEAAAATSSSSSSAMAWKSFS